MDYQSDFSVPEPTGFVPCSVCGRTFNPEVLARHQKICNKSQKKAAGMKKFDSSAQRKHGTDLEQFLASKPRGYLNRPSTSEVKAEERKKKLDWRRKHAQFVDTIKSARTVTIALQTGAPLPPPKPSGPNPDYVQCPYCSRHFQESAAERHIPFCKEQASRLERKPAAKAKESLNKRIQYKPPAVRKRGSVTEQKSTPRTGAPPGSSVVMRNTNFSGTYTVGSPSSNRTASGGRTGSMNKSSHIPVSTNRTPNSMAPISRQTSFTKRGKISNGGQLPVTENGFGEGHNGGASGGIIRSVASRRLYQGYEYSSDEGGNGDARNRAVRRRLVSGGKAGGSSGGSDRSSSPPSEGETRKGSGHRYQPQPPSHPPPESSHYIYATRSDPPPTMLPRLPDAPPTMARIHSSDSMGRGNSGRGGIRHVHLNEHGMPLSKFCYECGTKFPVPQAKYCCECGTKRI